MLLKSCSRCGDLIPYGAVYCSKCAPIVQAEKEKRLEESRKDSNRKYNQTRDPKYTRFYNSPDWRVLSAKYTQDKGYRCEACGKMATQVHHKKPIQTSEGWDRRLDYTNLELLCTSCHNERHDRFKKRQGYRSQNQKGQG